MTTIIKNVFDGVLTASLANTYVAPALTRGTIHAATFANPTAGVVTLEIKVIPASGGTARSVIPPVNLSVNEVFMAVELVNQTIEPGGSIQASGLGIEVVISAAERPTV